MKIIYFLIYIIFDCDYEADGRSTTSSLHVKATSNFDGSGCSVVCSDRANNSVVVETNIDPNTRLNKVLKGDVAVTIFYKCNQNITNTAANHYYSFENLCRNWTDKCREFDTTFFGQWTSNKIGNIDYLRVPLMLLYNVSSIVIRTKECIGKYREDKVLKFVLQHKNSSVEDTSFRISLENEDTLDITLSIKKFSYEVIANIIFNVTKSKCVDGWHMEDTSRRLGYRCSITLGNETIDAGYTDQLCPKNVTDREANCKEVGYFREDCTRMCFEYKDRHWAEGGYVAPKELASFKIMAAKLSNVIHGVNECNYSYSLCANGSEFCVNEVDGFSCSVGDYNMSQCFQGKNESVDWKCPVDEKASKFILDNPSVVRSRDNSLFYANLIKRKYQNGTGSEDELTSLYYILRLFWRRNGSCVLNVTRDQRKEYISFVLRKFIEILMKSMRSNVNDSGNGTVYSEDVYGYKSEVNQTETRHAIKLPEQLNNTDSVTLNLKGSDHLVGNDSVVKYLQFKRVDMIGDQTEMNASKNKNDSDLYRDYYSYNNKTREYLFQNSDIISVTFSNMTLFKSVKYKLKFRDARIPQNTWYYEFYTVCGTLELEKVYKWSSTNCTYNATDQTCECTHLSNFAALFAIKRVGDLHFNILRRLSNVGAIINSVSLTLFLIFVLCINSRDKLRIDQLNIAICVLLGTVVICIGPFIYKSNQQVCKGFALVGQYLFLSAFTWKLIFCLNVVLLISSMRHKNTDIFDKRRYLLFLVGYGVPVIIVGTSGYMFIDYYGRIFQPMCWIRPRSPASLTFLIPVAVVLAINLIGLFFIGVTLVSNKIKTRETKVNKSNDLVVFMQLLVCMGLTWIPGMMAVEYLWAMYLFVIFFPLQGLLMFLLVVLINIENRQKVYFFITTSIRSLTSKVTSGSDTKTTSKSKSRDQSKETDGSDNKLLTLEDRPTCLLRPEGTLVEINELMTTPDC